MGTTTTRKRWHTIFGALALATVAVGLSAAPAMARDGHRDGDHGRDFRDHGHGWDRRDHNWRPYYRPPVRVWDEYGYYVPPPVVYAPPPPVYYDPPAHYPAPGVTFGFNFR